MQDAILFGAWSGLLLTIMIGPVFFALIQTSVERDFVAGVALASGVALSDITYIVVATISTAILSQYDSFEAWLGLLGGSIMLVFGIVNASKGVKRPKNVVLGKLGVIQLVGQGFMLNGINPFVLLFWFSMATASSLRYQGNDYSKVIFFISLIVTVFTTDIIKAYVAVKLRSLLTLRRMLWLNRIVGVALVIFAFTLFHFAWKYWQAT